MELYPNWFHAPSLKFTHLPQFNPWSSSENRLNIIPKPLSNFLLYQIQHQIDVHFHLFEFALFEIKLNNKTEPYTN